MLIVTQDRFVLNLDHIASMWVEGIELHKFAVKADMDRYVSGRIIATYGTRERAVEELNRLVHYYRGGAAVYEMMSVKEDDA